MMIAISGCLPSAASNDSVDENLWKNLSEPPANNSEPVNIDDVDLDVDSDFADYAAFKQGLPRSRHATSEQQSDYAIVKNRLSAKMTSRVAELNPDEPYYSVPVKNREDRNEQIRKALEEFRRSRVNKKLQAVLNRDDGDYALVSGGMRGRVDPVGACNSRSADYGRSSAKQEESDYMLIGSAAESTTGRSESNYASIGYGNDIQGDYDYADIPPLPPSILQDESR